MVERGLDQADGLRRMFGGVRTRVLDIVSGSLGAGRTTVAVNLGAALARSGRNTLLVDFVTQPRASRAHDYLGATVLADQTIAAARKGLDLIALDHEAWIQRGPLPATALSDTTPRHRDGPVYDWVLVNGAGIEPVVASDDGTRDVLVVLSNDARSITETYALIKRMTANDRRCRCRVLVNRVASEAAAKKVFANLAHVARDYLAVELALVGYVPADTSIERAAAAGMSVFEHDAAPMAVQAYTRLAAAIGTRRLATPRPLNQVAHPAVAASVM